MKRIIFILALVTTIFSCTPEEVPPYDNYDEFVIWARENLIAPQILPDIWEDSITGFDTVYVCNITPSALSMFMVQHPLYPNEMIELGIYKPGETYEERIPGFKSGAVVLCHLRSWESNNPILHQCAPGGFAWCTKNGIAPIPNDDHSWCTNDYSNWFFIMSNEDCLCPYTDDPLNILCQWRQ